MPRPISDQIVLVTGATSGIGRAIALQLARLGARVIITARDAARGANTVLALQHESGNPRVELALVDFASLASVHSFLAALQERVERIDVLINNAGAMYTARRDTSDGHEMTFQVNHLSGFLTTLGLLPKLSAAGQARVVCMSSEAHRAARYDAADPELHNGWSAFGAYSASKLMNILFVREAARRLPPGLVINAMHPGMVASGFGRNDSKLMSLAVRLAAPFMKTPEQGADTAVWLATAPELAQVTGRYFARRKERAPSAAAQDSDAARALWELSEAIAAPVWPQGIGGIKAPFAGQPDGATAAPPSPPV